MGEYRKTAQKRMKDAEDEWRTWHKSVAKETRSMVGDMLVELDNRHQNLLSEFRAAGQRRDAVAGQIPDIQKEIQGIQKRMARGGVNWQQESLRLLNLAQRIGKVRSGFASVELTLRRVREEGPNASEILDHLTEELRKERDNWEQSASAFEHIYIELESAHLPVGFQEANDYVEQSSFEQHIALATRDDSPESVRAVAAELNELLYPKLGGEEQSGAEIAAKAAEKLLPASDEEGEN